MEWWVCIQCVFAAAKNFTVDTHSACWSNLLMTPETMKRERRRRRREGKKKVGGRGRERERERKKEIFGDLSHCQFCIDSWLLDRTPCSGSVFFVWRFKLIRLHLTGAQRVCSENPRCLTSLTLTAFSVLVLLFLLKYYFCVFGEETRHELRRICLFSLASSSCGFCGTKQEIKFSRAVCEC